MAKTVAIGIQDFGKLIQNQCFYVDKTDFIREWWENGDDVTLIARPRRFGKTLNMSMLEHFFSVKYAGQGKIFEGLAIWEQETYRKLQGTYPVISLSFANIKERTLKKTLERLKQIIAELYSRNYFLMESGLLMPEEKEYFERVRLDMPDTTATYAIHRMSEFLSRY